MIQEHLQFELLGKKTFEKAVVCPPFRFQADLPDEACFYYTTHGQTEIYGPGGKLVNRTNEGIVMRCGSYLNEFYRQKVAIIVK